MNTDEREQRLWLTVLSGKLIGACYAVSNELGCGFAEKVYENALMIELRERGIAARQQATLQVRYHTEIVGEFIPDLLVENQLLVELKSVPSLESFHEAQCINYLRASGLGLCLLINFGRPGVEVRRFVNG